MGDNGDKMKTKEWPSLVTVGGVVVGLTVAGGLAAYLLTREGSSGSDNHDKNSIDSSSSTPSATVTSGASTSSLTPLPSSTSTSTTTSSACVATATTTTTVTSSTAAAAAAAASAPVSGSSPSSPHPSPPTAAPPPLSAPPVSETSPSSLPSPPADTPVPERASSRVVAAGPTVSPPLQPLPTMDFEALARNVRPVGPSTQVYKDQCVYSFDTPLSPEGLFVSLTSFVGVGAAFLHTYHAKTGDRVFLQIKGKATKKADPVGEPEKITKLAIGVPGGIPLGVDQYEYTYTHMLFVMPEFSFFEVAPTLPSAILDSVAGVIVAVSTTHVEEAAAWVDDIKPSKLSADLKQLNNGVKVPPSGLKCSECDITDNLWMNLTDGCILCGRKNDDGTGGNGHALAHYNKTGYPLAVKLGTITPQGADVYSYPENDMVVDTKLAEHLAHFGINMQLMTKTAKSMLELDLENINKMRSESNRIIESGQKLVPVYGPTYCGMRNLGNSCYLNSVVQCLMSTKDFRDRYYTQAASIFESCPANPTEDVLAQLAKVGSALNSGVYSQQPVGDVPPDSIGVAPHAFRARMGRGHPEFSTKGQQDAFEYFQHLLSMVERAERAGGSGANPGAAFSFETEVRIQCGGSGAVGYRSESTNFIGLPVPLSHMTNGNEYHQWKAREAELKANPSLRTDADQSVAAVVPFEACLAAAFAEETIEGWKSPVLDARVQALKMTRLKTMPKYLVLQIRKFTISENWEPAKLDVRVAVPTTLDLEFLRSRGPQPGEQIMDVGAASRPSAPTGPTVSEEVLANIMAMGFGRNAAVRAAMATGGSNPDAAATWLFSHLEDADINDPLPTPTGDSDGGDSFDPDTVANLVGFGFDEAVVKYALKETKGNTERAADWLFSHPDFVVPKSSGAAASGPATASLADGPGQYTLIGFVSHMGTSAASGHYVCHLLREGRWVLFNDENVALSQTPPFDMGYMYFFERQGSI